MDLAQLVRRTARQFPHADAIGTKTQTISMRAAVDRAERFANALDAAGVPPEAAVGVLSENRAEYPEVDLGLTLGRRIRVALNSRLAIADWRFALDDCGARALVFSGSFSAEAQTLADDLDLMAINLDDPQFGESSYATMIERAVATPIVRSGSVEFPAWISYTSGTTGRPKGVVLSHRAIREVSSNLLLELGPLTPGERIVLAQPLSHGAGYFVLPQLISGGGVYVMTTFDAEEVLWAGQQPGVTTLKAVPAMFPPLLEAAQQQREPFGYDTVMYGAAPMPGPVMEQALDQFGNVLIQIYGQSEAPITLSCLHKHDHAVPGPHRGSAGRPWRFVDMEIRHPDGSIVAAGEPGEVTIRGAHHMTGYHRLPEATDKVLRDGWVWTKDIGRFDENGYLYLLGRRDEIINSGGFNVSPREVEQVIQDHPDVAECVVVGLPDERWGSAINAMVRLRSGATVTPDELMEFARPLLTFRAPKRVVVAEDIPRNPYGKVDRQRVLAALGAAANASL